MENILHLTGTAAADPVWSHESHGLPFYTFPLEVLRLSGTADTLNVTAPAAMCRSLTAGVRLRLFGQVRSHNSRGPAGSRLRILAWAKSLEPTDEPDANRVTLSGVICRPTVYRCTPYGREITDVMLRVERTLPPEASPRRPRCDYIPCVTWGSVARHCAGLAPGTPVRFEGRLQSRTYTKTLDGVPEQRVAYEVSVAQCHSV